MSRVRVRWLLGALFILTVVKFGILPWSEWQNEQRDQLKILDSRLVKSELVLSNQAAIDLSLAALSKSIGSLDARFSKFADEESFRLAEQQRVTQELEKHNLSLVSFDWLLSGTDDATELRFSKFRVQATGSISSQARFLGSLEGGQGAVLFREVVLSPREPLSAPTSSAVVEMTLVADSFFR